MKLLILGGSGQLSGRVAELALAQGHDVWTLTRGVRPLPEGVHALTADREDDVSVRRAVEGANTRWDACIDCTGRTPQSAAQCVEIIGRHAERFVVVSTDSVYHPAHKDVPQNESNEHYLTDGGYGATKRLMEEVFIASGLNYTIFRPGHIFGAGFQLGCYPEHTRQPDLLAHLRAGQPLRLVGGGEFLIHPIYMDDLALAILDSVDKPAAFRQIFCIGGTDVVTNADYYRLLGRIIGCDVTIETVPLEGYLTAHPQYSGHLCHRSYDMTKLRQAGIRVPCTSLEEGLREQVAWLERGEVKLMTPERVQFHLMMLEAGERALFAAELEAAQEAENPLSELTLALSICGSDEESMHVLREYQLDHPADMAQVEQMLRQELRTRLEQGAMSPETCLQMMHNLTCDTSDGHALELFADVVAVEEYCDLAADGILCEEAYVLCLEALLKAEPLPDVWKLHREILRAKKKGEPFPGEGHPGVLTLPE